MIDQETRTVDDDYFQSYHLVMNKIQEIFHNNKSVLDGIKPVLHQTLEGLGPDLAKELLIAVSLRIGSLTGLAPRLQWLNQFSPYI